MIGKVVNRAKPVTNHRDWLIIEKHKKLRKLYGKPTLCENCGATENIEYANISKTYSSDRSDYKTLCRSCHRKYDYEPTKDCKNGHLYTPENTAIRKRQGRNDSRMCLECRLINNRRR